MAQEGHLINKIYTADSLEDVSTIIEKSKGAWNQIKESLLTNHQ